MNRPTDSVIGMDDLFAAGAQLNGEDAVRAAMARLSEIEPELTGYLDREMVQMAGRLVLAGASTTVCREMTTIVLATVLTTFAAQRAASIRLWADALKDTPLAQLIPLFPPQEPPPSTSPPDEREKLPF